MMTFRSHPYLSGNFAPIKVTRELCQCSTWGQVPTELAGGQYVRNGGNPATNESLGRDAHWFDGDGMLSGVLFRRQHGRRSNAIISPEFVNKYIMTDVYISSRASPFLTTPILPSIATLVNPLSSLFYILSRIVRTLLLVLLSHLPGSSQAIRRISVANTALLYHDGRALATCESGPPMRIALPGLDTIGWYNGVLSEGEAGHDPNHGSVLGGSGLHGFMREWTTAHPRVDPRSGEMILYHSCFIPPYINYSVIPSNSQSKLADGYTRTLVNRSIPGISSPKLMHDFGVTFSHTIILDLPLSLDPLNLAKNKPVVRYDPTAQSRFGVFPRYNPEHIRWFQTKACCIFHTANSWTSSTQVSRNTASPTETINLLVCRLTSASIVFSAGDIAAPIPSRPIPVEDQEEEQSRLYYYQFDMAAKTSDAQNRIVHQWALSAIPFEFPTLRPSVAMSAARFIYGCSSSDSSFGAALGRAAKIDVLVKFNALSLIERGIAHPPEQIRGCVDQRGTWDFLDGRKQPNDDIMVFHLPNGYYAQEPRFVARANGTSEDDGWLLTYVFDESQLDERGECTSNARSELWIIDAKNMRDIIAKIYLPQRVPYGLHGHWFSEQEIIGQRQWSSRRSVPERTDRHRKKSSSWRRIVEKLLR